MEEAARVSAVPTGCGRAHRYACPAVLVTTVSAGAPRRTENEAALASSAAGYWGAAGGRVGSPRRRGLEACRRAGAEGGRAAPGRPSVRV